MKILKKKKRSIDQFRQLLSRFLHLSQRWKSPEAPLNMGLSADKIDTGPFVRAAAAAATAEGNSTSLPRKACKPSCVSEDPEHAPK